MTDVSNVSFVGASQEAGAETAWTMEFTVTTRLTGGDSFSFKFPAEWDLSGVFTGSSFPNMATGFTFGGEWAEGAYCYNVAITNNLIRGSIWSSVDPGGDILPAGATATVTITPITNPAAATYPAADFYIATNRDIGQINPPSDITITGGAVVPTATVANFTDPTADSVQANGIVSANGAETTVLFRYGTDPTLASGTSTVNATQSPLAEGASLAPVSAEIGSLTNQRYYYRVEATNSEGTTNSAIIPFSPTGARYWIGGSGNWSDAAEWSTSSGGSGGVGAPVWSNEAIFDANSFSAGSQSVVLDVNAACLSMDWTGATNTPDFDMGHSNDFSLTITESLTFIEAMTVSGGGSAGVFFDGPTGGNVTLAGNVLPGSGAQNMRFSGGGSWEMTEDWGAMAQLRITVEHGEFTSNGYDLEVRQIVDGAGLDPGTVVIDLTGSDAIVHDAISVGLEGTTFTPPATLVLIPDVDFIILAVRTVVFPVVSVFQGTNTGSILSMSGTITFSDLTLEPGSGSYNLNGVTIGTAHWLGEEGNLLKITGNFTATQTISGDYLEVTNSTVTGPPAYAGGNSIDGGGNTGWLFVAAPPEGRALTPQIPSIPSVPSIG